MNQSESGSTIPLFKHASPQHRLGGYAVNFAFSFITLGIGWLIWSFVTWSHGQTPAHQILKMRVYSTSSNKPASWGRMLLRSLGVPTFFALPSLSFIALGFIIVSKTEHRGIGIAVIIAGYIFSIAINLFDALWIFHGESKQRLVDLFANTVVLNESEPLLFGESLNLE